MIEVADASWQRDRTLKSIYAQAGMAVYWIVNLVERHIETYTAPVARPPRLITASNASMHRARKFRSCSTAKRLRDCRCKTCCRNIIMPMQSAPRTMFEKIWDHHVVHAEKGKQTILYIDLQLVHEVTSPQAFESLRLAGRKVRRPERTVATVDHNVPTTGRRLPIADEIAKQQIDTLRQNCRDFGIRFYDLDDRNQGIVHVIGPELGLTQPGMTIVCGDSHTATHGAFGALAFGIGTSEVEHVLATQTLLQHKPRTLEIRVEGRLPSGVTAKDLILWLIGQISTSGGTGYCIEYTGTRDPRP